MNLNIVENSPIAINNFGINVELKELNNHGVVNFEVKNGETSLWDGKKVTIPVHGVYKISWGFYQESITTFYKDLETKLALIINNKPYDDKAVISHKTPCYHAVKSSHVTASLLLRENETICLYPEIINAEKPIMKNVYLKVERLYR
ncbi:hypothetical protein [uncultured Polaribacter sp.]|uniref:hypothetical protein n=1 Tax=uncultured Polaribacter sp. TaxID=174711 RepID=UPI0026040DA3|nr:hypothetical protein [uncultured Polaribacter sp.]